MPVHCKLSSLRDASWWTVFSSIRAADFSAPIVLLSRFHFRLPSTSFFIFCTYRFTFDCFQWVYSFQFRSITLIILVHWLFFNKRRWSCPTQSSKNSVRPHRNSSWSHAWHSYLWHFGVTKSCSIRHSCKAFFAYIWALRIFQGVKYMWDFIKKERILPNNSKAFAKIPHRFFTSIFACVDILLYLSLPNKNSLSWSENKPLQWN